MIGFEFAIVSQFVVGGSLWNIDDFAPRMRKCFVQNVISMIIDVITRLLLAHFVNPNERIEIVLLGKENAVDDGLKEKGSRRRLFEDSGNVKNATVLLWVVTKGLSGVGVVGKEL